MNPLWIFLVLVSIAQSTPEGEIFSAPQTCSESSDAAPIEKRQSDGETLHIRSVAQSQCMQGGDPADHTELVEVRDCNAQFALQQFTVKKAFRGVMLSTPWNNGERCVYTGDQEGQLLWTSECNPSCPVFRWEMIKVEGGHLLKHMYSSFCASAEGRYIRIRNCDSADSKMVWDIQK